MCGAGWTRNWNWCSGAAAVEQARPAEAEAGRHAMLAKRTASEDVTVETHRPGRRAASVSTSQEVRWTSAPQDVYRRRVCLLGSRALTVPRSNMEPQHVQRGECVNQKAVGGIRDTG